MCRTLDERGINVGSEKEEGALAVGVEKEEVGPFVGAKGGGGRTCCRRWRSCTGELEVDNLS